MACLFSLSEAAVTPAVLRTGCDENNDLVVSLLASCCFADENDCVSM
jgi:hypothetical protein